MYTFATIGMTKKALAVGLAATAILSGGVAAEASGTTAAIMSRVEARVAAQDGRAKALETLAHIDANTHATAGLDKARVAVSADRPAIDAAADVDARASGDAGIGTAVSAEAQTRRGAMKEFVLNLLGIETRGDARASVSANAGTDTAINAVTNAKANTAAEGGISTALNAIGGNHEADTSADADTHAAAGLSTALDAVTSAGAEASGGVSSESNLTAQSTLEGLTANGAANGSSNLRLGLRSR